MLKKMKRRVGPVSLSLAAAALTAVALAAVSFAAKDDGSKQGNGDVVRPGPGGGPSGGGPPGAGFRMELSEEDREALEEFRSCMSDEGVDLPEPPPEPGSEGSDGERGERRSEHRLKPPSDEERAKMEEAFEACKDKLPEGAGQMGRPCGPPHGGPEGEGAALPARPPGNRDS
jgi:hypothetical protein